MKVYIDGSYVSYRSKTDYFQKMGFVDNEGNWIYTGTIYSFLRDLLHLVERYPNSEFGVVWDRTPIERLEMDNSYKSHRRNDMTEEERVAHISMKRQMKELVVLLRALGVRQFYCERYEADDVLATLARRKDKAILVVNDKDMYQAINENVVLYNFKEERGYDWFCKKYNIEPIDWIGVQALMGDSTDNVEGFKGVGEKTAVKLMIVYKDPFKALEALKLHDKIEQLELAKKLVTLVTDVPYKIIKPERDRWMFRHLLIVKRMRKFSREFDRFERFFK